MKGEAMDIYIFKSEASNGLRAFAGDAAGRQLPDRLGPWQAIGVVTPERIFPHNLSRVAVEKAIEIGGFQLWRFKSKGR